MNRAPPAPNLRATAVLYFDHNASSPLIPAARDAWLAATERFIGNPSSPHRLGARADVALNEAREKLAAILGCAPHEIVWTSGATESNNTAIHHLAATRDGEAWISAIEHPCLIESVRHHFAKRHRFIPVDARGVVQLDWLREEFSQKTPATVSVMAANNETGVLQPWREIAALCREHGVPFHCDAAQWLGKLPATGLGACEFVSGCAHKFGGPQGVGFLKCPTATRPLLLGGPQEDGRRAGTENVAGVLVMLAVLEARTASLTPEWLMEKVEVRASFEQRLKKALPEVEIIGESADRLWNTVSAVMPEIDCRQRWVVKLDRLGFAVSTGSACASGKEQQSHVLAAMGLASGKSSRVLRFSSSHETRPGDWDALLDGIVEAHRAFLDASEG